MSRLYRTIDGDMADALALRLLGSAQHVVLLLEANPGLPAHGAVLPAGLVLVIPPTPVSTSRSTMRLWGRSE